MDIQYFVVGCLQKLLGYFNKKQISPAYRFISTICRLSDCFTYLKFTYFVYQSGCVFRSERAPIGIGNGTIRSSYFPST